MINDPTDADPAVETLNTAPEPTEPDLDEELWRRATVQKYFGGEKPIHVSTLYRGIDAEIYPKPLNVAPNVVRWVPSECRAARKRMLDKRNEPKSPTGRGRKRRIITNT